MSGTLFAQNALQTSVGFMASGLIGILFGFFLEQAGFGSSRRLTGIFYLRDMAVLKVMFTAVVVAGVGYRYLIAMGWLSPEQIYLMDTYWLGQAVGGLIFGVGFVMGGWCPGTAMVGMASAKIDAMIFLLGVLVGSILFNEIFDLILPVYEGLHGGTLYLYDTFHTSPERIILAFCVVAVFAFAVSTLIERKIGSVPRMPSEGLKRHAVAASLLILCAGLLTVTPKRPFQRDTAMLSAGFLSEVSEAKDHIDPMELAERLIREDSGLTLVDLRSPSEFSQFHLRGAINIPLESLAHSVTTLPRDQLIVLYTNGTTHAAQAWLELRRSGWDNVKVLTDGLLGFWRECLTPPSLTGFTSEGQSSKAYGSFSKRRAFFLGNRENRVRQ